MVVTEDLPKSGHTSYTRVSLTKNNPRPEHVTNFLVGLKSLKHGGTLCICILNSYASRSFIAFLTR